ncbi:hypothetical protein DSO57_1034045, partial [Entomophthora muscae]
LARKRTCAFQAALKLHNLINTLEKNNNEVIDITHLYKLAGLTEKAGTRIDFVLISSSLRPFVKRVCPLEHHESDHFHVSLL